jgi:hypothetical protein
MVNEEMNFNDLKDLFSLQMVTWPVISKLWKKTKSSKLKRDLSAEKPILLMPLPNWERKLSNHILRHWKK